MRSVSPSFGTRFGNAGVLLLLATSLVAAQGQPASTVAQPAPAPAPAQSPEVPGPFGKVQITAGRSTVVASAFDVTRIAVTNPEIADAVVVAPREILIDGKKPGTISLIVW